MRCSLVCVTAHPSERWDEVADGCAGALRPRGSTARHRASRRRTSRAGPARCAGTRPATPALPARGRRGRGRPGRTAWRSPRPPRPAVPPMLLGGTWPSTTAAVVPAVWEGRRRWTPRIAGRTAWTGPARSPRSPLSLELERPGDHCRRPPAQVLADAEAGRPVTARAPAVDGLRRRWRGSDVERLIATPTPRTRPADLRVQPMVAGIQVGMARLPLHHHHGSDRPRLVPDRTLLRLPRLHASRPACQPERTLVGEPGGVLRLPAYDSPLSSSRSTT